MELFTLPTTLASAESMASLHASMIHFPAIPHFAVMSFLDPGYLWALIAVPMVWVWPRRPIDVRHGLVRSCLLGLLAFALARPVFLQNEEPTRHVVILDRSASVPDSDAARAAEVAEAAVRTVSDGPTVLIEITGGEGRVPSLVEADEKVEVDGSRASSLANALGLAARAIPDGSPGVITLISDGQATDRHWGEVVQELSVRGIPLNVAELEVEFDRPSLVSFTMPDQVCVGHTVTASFRAYGWGRADAVLRSDDQVIAAVPSVDVKGGTDIRFSFEPPTAGFHDYTLQLTAEGGGALHSELNHLVAVQPPLRVLYVGGRTERGADSIAKLLGEGFEVADAGGGEPPAPGDYDAVVLDDRPASTLSEPWQMAVAEAVRSRGTGLFASGGRAAFGPGGYYDSPIADILPVDLIQKEEKKDPSTTLAIIVDTSGSMVGNRMTIAKQVARLAMRRLQPHDKVGIVEFYGTKQWAAPIQSAANQIDLQRAINRLGAEGGTVLLPAIEEAYYAMKNVQTRYKHVLVLTDAGVETGPYERVLRTMSDEGITVSTVLVGPGRHSDFLVDLADWGGGRYYNAPDRMNLPELLLKKPSTSVLPSYRPETMSLQADAGEGWFGDVDPSSMPPIDGFVETELRDGAEQLLGAAGSNKPVMASWATGMGRVTAFLTEPVGDGTASWAGWDGYGSMLGRVLARTARGATDPYVYRLTRRDTHTRLEARRMLRDAVPPQVTRVDRSGAELGRYPMRRTAPDLFVGELDSAIDQSVLLTASAGSSRPTLLAAAAFSDRFPERQVDPARGFPMAAAAELTGGMRVDLASPSTVSPQVGSGPLSLWELWPWLALSSLLLFIVDLFVRRSAPRRSAALSGGSAQ